MSPMWLSPTWLVPSALTCGSSACCTGQVPAAWVRYASSVRPTPPCQEKNHPRPSVATPCDRVSALAPRNSSVLTSFHVGAQSAGAAEVTVGRPRSVREATATAAWSTRRGTLPGSTEQPLLPAPMSVLYLTDHDWQDVSSQTACSDAGGAVGFARRGPRSAR